MTKSRIRNLSALALFSFGVSWIIISPRMSELALGMMIGGISLAWYDTAVREEEAEKRKEKLRNKIKNIRKNVS